MERLKQNQQSFTYRVLKNIGLNFSEEEYGRISISKAIMEGTLFVLKSIMHKYCMYSVLLGPLNFRLVRPLLWRILGCKVGKHVFIGYEVMMDFPNARLIEIEDYVHITNRCLLLCHNRDLSEYHTGGNIASLGYKKKGIRLKKGCHVGMGSIILPGVTIGEGSIVGAGSVVTTDVPPWTITAGVPAKVVKTIQSPSVESVGVVESE